MVGWQMALQLGNGSSRLINNAKIKCCTVQSLKPAVKHQMLLASQCFPQQTACKNIKLSSDHKFTNIQIRLYCNNIVRNLAKRFMSY